MHRLLLAFSALCVAGALPAAADPALPRRQRVDAAIERGVAWLLSEQKPGGTWGTGKHALGKTALAVHALQHCGLAEDQGSRESRRLVKAFRFLDRTGAGRKRRRDADTRTYECALLLMILRARGRAQDRERMQRLADLLVATQTANGQWWYDGEGARLRYGGDNSNTQFATLALGQAHGEGLRVPRDCLAKVLAWWSDSPGARGGFGYASGGSAKSASTGSMTAAGIASLAIARTILGEPAAPGDATAATKAAQVQARAIAYLADVFSVVRNHGPALDRKGQRQRKSGRGWLHYYLWTVERAMVLAGQEKLGGKDWYAEGARHLLGTQKDDGSWRGEHPLYATCFALLFLTRAADRPRAFTPGPRPVEPGASRGPIVTPPSARPPAPPDDAGPAQGGPARPPELPPGTVLDWLREQLPPGELPRRCRLAGAGSLLPLVRALQDPAAPIRQRAFEALRELLPDERAWRADRHPLPRGRLALWLRQRARHLVLKGGRFVEP